MKLRKVMASILALAMVVAGIGTGTPNSVAKDKKPKLKKKNFSVVKGKTAKITISGKKIKKTKWFIKSTKIATLSKKKKTSVVVKGMKAGKSTTVTAKVTVKGKKKPYKLNCKVTVKNMPKAKHSITYISDRSVEYISKDGVYRVFFSLMYEDGTTRTFSSGNASISIKNTNGEMVYNKNIAFSQNDFSNWTSIAYGTRYLCCIEIKKSDIAIGQVDTGELRLGVTLNNGSTFNSRAYSVNNLPVVEPAITLDNNVISLFEGESVKLNATVQNYSKALSWTSSNTDVATCYNGKVTAKAQGTTTITVMAGSAKATCIVTVKPIGVTFICEDGQTVSYNKASNYVKFTDVTYSISKNTMTINYKATRMGATYYLMFANYKIVSGDTVVQSSSVTGKTSLRDLGAGESAFYSISVPVVNGETYKLIFFNN